MIGFGQGRGSATLATVGDGRIEPGLRALADDRALKLGQGREEVKDETSTTCCGVDRFGQRPESYLPFV